MRRLWRAVVQMDRDDEIDLWYGVGGSMLAQLEVYRTMRKD